MNAITDRRAGCAGRFAAITAGRHSTTGRHSRPYGQCRPRGFTLVEVTVASGTMAVLAVLLSAAWSGLGRPMAEMIARHRLTQEAHLAVAALARDLGGTPAGPQAALGRKEQGQLVGWMHPADSQLWLCFDAPDEPNGVADWGPPNAVIVYQQDADRLVRYDRTANTSLTVASGVDSFQVAACGDRDLEIRLTLRSRAAAATYILIARGP